MPEAQPSGVELRQLHLFDRGLVAINNKGPAFTGFSAAFALFSFFLLFSRLAHGSVLLLSIFAGQATSKPTS